MLEVFAKMDSEDNGDIELEEFRNGMHDLDAELNDDEVEQIFKLMDSDASDFIDSNEFVMFLTQKFESSELTRFQQAILSKVNYNIYQ